MSFRAWLGIVNASLAATRQSLDAMERMTSGWEADATDRAAEPWHWTSANTIVRDLATMRVREFRTGTTGPGVILIAPFALHTATIADIAPGHSVIEALQRGGIARIWLTEWRSADATRRHQSIDACLADLNVVVDDFGTPAPLAGLCQGGMLATIYAARFPDKVDRLALVGAPIDVAAAPSMLTETVAQTPPSAVEAMLAQGDGLVRGRLMTDLWPSATADTAALAAILQCRSVPAALRARYLSWNDDVVDLPGAFYRETVDWIFRENRLAGGTFPALGREVGIAAIRCPLFLAAAADDEIVSPPQLLAIASHVASAAADITSRTVAGRHLSLFMGHEVLRTTWPDIAAFLSRDTGQPTSSRKRKASARPRSSAVPR
jgi:poly(3-hydroxyalkanoate) synthetase